MRVRGEVESEAVVAKCGCVCACGREMAPVCEDPSSHAFIPCSRSIHCRKGGDGWQSTGEHAPCLLTLVRERGGGKVREGGGSPVARRTDGARHP